MGNSPGIMKAAKYKKKVKDMQLHAWTTISS